LECFVSFLKFSPEDLDSGLTNSVDFTEIRWIQSPPNFKTGDFIVHIFEIFEKIKRYVKKIE
jgi:hypothetical protein